MGLTPAVAAEIAQETFVRAWRNLGQYDPARAEFSTWLFSIARNIALNELTKASRKREAAMGTTAAHAAFVAFVFIIQPLITSYVRQHQMESFHDPSSSMEPTLMHGDFLFADKRYNCPNCKGAVQRGDIALFTYPNNRNVYYVKRIVGRPGEHVQVRDRRVTVNGRSLWMSESRTPEGLTIT
jgi:signal peptidase I